jgi:hypothetical protein
MTTQNALEWIRILGDRAVQRGNIFMNTAEVLSFIEAFNELTKIAIEAETHKSKVVNEESNHKQLTS